MIIKEQLSEYINKGAFYKTVVEDGSDMIFIVDYDGIIHFSNTSVEDTLGHQPSALNGKNFFDFIFPETLDKLKEKFKECTKTPYIDKVEFQFLCEDKTYKYLEFNSVNIYHKSGIEGLLLDCRDITERKKNAEELLRARKSKEQFLANMSHEIRTPINGIAGMITLLEETAVTPEQKKYLNAIKNSTDNLKVIINDILDFSVIESGKLKFEQIGFNIATHLPSVIETFLYQAKEKGIQLTYSIDAQLNTVILGDPVRYSQIVINLVSNAVKFTPTGEIRILVRAKEKLNDQILVETKVVDTGIGITEEKLESIFESFNQGDVSVTRRFGGTGLGLAISKQLVELQNGTITVSSKENEGTAFTFDIPYRIGSEEDLKDKDYPENRSSNITNEFSFPGMKVLLVEDNDINRMYAATILKRWDCHVDMAENGLIAVEKVQKNDYDIILMDIQMPVMDGYEASKAIKQSASPKKSAIPIIALTANALKGIDSKSEGVGMEGYVTKPFIPSDLHKLLSKYYLQTPHKTTIVEDTTALEKPKSSNEFQHIDLSYLRNVCSNDKGFIEEMIKTFLSATPESLEIIKNASSQSNWLKVGNEAHKIKPSITFMGIETMKPLVKQIEVNAKESKNTQDLPGMIQHFEEEFLSAKEELEHILKEKIF